MLKDFQEKERKGLEELEKKLSPVVKKVALNNDIGMVFRATPGLIFVVDPNLDITLLVIEAFNEEQTAPSDEENRTDA